MFSNLRLLLFLSPGSSLDYEDKLRRHSFAVCQVMIVSTALYTAWNFLRRPEAGDRSEDVPYRNTYELNRLERDFPAGVLMARGISYPCKAQ